MKNIIIIGATSGIGKSLAEIYGKTNAKIGLLGRRENLLEEICQLNPQKFCSMRCDINDIEQAQEALEELKEQLGQIDLFIITAGIGDLNETLKYKTEAKTLQTNVMAWTFLVDWIYNFLEHQGYGQLVNISSVGGLRGSAMAPAYNASKAFQMNYMEGIRQKATKSKQPIYTTDIRPGFIDTAMAKGDGIFWMASQEKAGQQIYNAIEKKRKIAYITKRWKYIAFILKHLPAYLYCKL